MIVMSELIVECRPDGLLSVEEERSKCLWLGGGGGGSMRERGRK